MTLHLTAPLALVLTVVAAQAAPLGSAFTYQGRLEEGNASAQGLYDFTFALCEDAAGGSPLCSPIFWPAVGVTNGWFTVHLDFGTAAFAGDARWLELGVRTNGSGPFATLSPRQAITATPYALQAATVGEVPAASIIGTLGEAQLSTNVARLNASPQFSGSVQAAGFTGDGSGLTALNAAAVGPAGTFSVPPPFRLVSSPAVGMGPATVAAADFDGDGSPDLVCANFSAQNTVTMVTNNGDGEFGRATAPLAGPYPRSVAVADVNADGWPDVISANAASNTLAVLTNNQRGRLVRSALPPAGAAPWAVAAADLNGDGSVDLISANAGTNTLTILTNDGGGNFTAASTNVVGVSPHGVAAADLNHDGWVDLVSADNGAQSLTVLGNDGTGAFVPAATYAASAYPESVIVADVNRDNRPDLISVGLGATSGSGSLHVLTNDGDGNFVLACRNDELGDARSVVAADLNGDGWLDLASPIAAMNRLTVLTNDQQGGFEVFVQPLVGDRPYGITAADVNGDGWQDLIAANYLDYSLSVLLNGGSGVNANLNRVVAHSFFGDGAALTNLNASQLTGGTISDALLPASLARLDADQTFNGANTFDNPANAFAGNGAGLTGLSAGQLTSGTISDALLPGNLARLGASQTFTGANTFNNPANTFVGNGAGLTGLNAANLATGTLPSVRLAGTYSGAVWFDNPANTFVGSGAGLTSLSADHLATGTVPDARLSANIPRLNASATFTGTPSFEAASGAPFAVSSPTKVTSLNADLLDGLEAADFASAAHGHYGSAWSGTATKGLSLRTDASGWGAAAVHGQQGTGNGNNFVSPAGVWGDSSTGYGVLGSSLNSAGVLGFAASATGLVQGVKGETISTGGRGVAGFAFATSGTNHGVYGETASTDGVGVLGTAPAGGVALKAAGSGVIQSSADSYVFVPGNMLVKNLSDDTTRWDIQANGSARIWRGANAGDKTVYFPVVLPAVLYGQPVKVTEMTVYYVCNNSTNGFITSTYAAKQADADSSAMLFNNLTDRTNTTAASFTFLLGSNNVLSAEQGALGVYLTLSFADDSAWVQIGGLRFKLTHE